VAGIFLLAASDALRQVGPCRQRSKAHASGVHGGSVPTKLAAKMATPITLDDAW